MDSERILRALLRKLQLGEPLAAPCRVHGGFLHKMYRIETQRAVYAIKLLNPQIMLRPDVFDNYACAETLERKLQEYDIPVVPALSFGGRKMQSVEGRYAYLFPWVDGKALTWEETTCAHCETIAQVTAAIHNIEQRQEHSAQQAMDIDWARFLSLAQAQAAPCAEALYAHQGLLYEAQHRYNQAMAQLPPLQCICHGDMDSKNVLWVHGKPQIIDLECLAYGNPYNEAFQLALSWAGVVTCETNLALVRSFLAAYGAASHVPAVDWSTLAGCGFFWLDWLAYNVRRALLIECNDAEEQALGASEVENTLRRIAHYRDIIPSLF